MNIYLHKNKQAAGEAAAQLGATALRQALRERTFATIIVATGASQFGMLETLTRCEDIDWSKVTIFHLDEYLGIDETHPASFRRYLRERLIHRVGRVREFVAINGSASSVSEELARLKSAISQHDIDICFAGIGENCHLAFNDPPADFTTHEPYLRVALDTACRQQQLNEGWFSSLEDVPTHAISMSIPQIARAKKIILTVPDERKARAVAAAVEGEITPLHPASYLQQHQDCAIYLDPQSASLLRQRSSGA